MRFNSINNNEIYFISVSGVQVFSGVAPTPEGWSGKGTEDHDHRLFSEQLRQADRVSLNVFQGEVNGRLPLSEAYILEFSRGSHRLAVPG